MNKYTHSFLAFKSIERLEKASLPKSYKKYSKSLIEWFKNNKDGIIRGSWYPDKVIKDMANSHIYKLKPTYEKAEKILRLPSNLLIYKEGKVSKFYKKLLLKTDRNDDLPSRCDAIGQSIIDSLKIQKTEEKGSSISPNNNQISLLFFMLSHYIADGFMPFHCDYRKFSNGIDIHRKLENSWEDDK